MPRIRLRDTLVVRLRGLAPILPLDTYNVDTSEASTQTDGVLEEVVYLAEPFPEPSAPPSSPSREVVDQEPRRSVIRVLTYRAFSLTGSFLYTLARVGCRTRRSRSDILNLIFQVIKVYGPGLAATTLFSQGSIVLQHISTLYGEENPLTEQ